jgi:MOSC domain-containing protein YiiM
VARITAVCTSKDKGVRKENVGEGRMVPEWGLEGDAHAGPWHRQVSLLAVESIGRMREKGLDVGPGDFAENLTVEGLVLHELPIGTRLALGGEAVGEVTQIGKKCHAGCAIFKLTGDCVMPREGIFVRVLTGGTVRVGDEVRVLTASGA